MKFYKPCALILCIMLCVTLCGCWNYMDVESEFVAMGITIDKDKATNEYKICVEVAKSKGGQNPELLTEVETARGITIFDAMRNIISKEGAKLYWGHAMVYIISESVAKEGISDVMSLPGTQKQMRSDIFIMICEDESIDKVFSFKGSIHDTVSQHIHDLFESYEASAKFRRCTLFEVLQELASDEVCLMLPYIKMVYDKNQSQNNGGNTSGQASDENSSNNENPNDTLIVSGSAVFKGDKEIDIFDETQTRSALILKNEATKNYNIAMPANGEIPNCSMEDISSSLSIKPVLGKDSTLSFKISLKLDADVVEIQTTEDYINDKKKGEIEDAFQNMIRGQLFDAIQKAQNDGADIFGFEGNTHRKYPAFYKKVSSDFSNIFAHAAVYISVAVDITNSSLRMKPVKVGQ